MTEQTKVPVETTKPVELSEQEKAAQEEARLQAVGRWIAKAIGGSVWTAILKSGQLSTFAKRLEERKAIEATYLAEHPEGCIKCLGTGVYSQTTEVVLGESFVVRQYCHCIDGVSLEAKNQGSMDAYHAKKRLESKMQEKRDLQKSYDKISSVFSTAFGTKYYRDGQCVVNLWAKNLPWDSHQSVRSKKDMERALTMVIDDVEKYLIEMGWLNLYIYGDSGVGKTHNGVAAFHKIRSSKASVTTMYILFDEYLDFLKEWFDRKGEFRGISGSSSKFSSLYANPKLSAKVEQYLYDCDVLFVDEIFATMGKTSEYYATKLKALLDRRNASCKVTVFLSNKSMGEARTLISASFNANHGEETRIFNRMRENGHIIFDRALMSDPDRYGVHVIGTPLNNPIIDTSLLHQNEQPVVTAESTGKKESNPLAELRKTSRKQ